MLSQLPLALVVSFAAALDIQNKGGGTALIINDVQTCFLEGGSLGVTGGNSVKDKIQQIYDEKSCLFDLVVQSQDFHPENHISFAEEHGLPPFADLTLGKGELPITCIEPANGNIAEAACCPSYYLDDDIDCNTVLCPGPNGDGKNADGSAFTYASDSIVIAGNPACTTCAAGASPQSCFTTTQRMWPVHCLSTPGGDNALELDIDESKYELIQKGDNQFVDAYSAFADNTNNLQTPLQDLLQANGIKRVYIVGLATDVVVNYTVRDAVLRGYRTTVVGDATAGVSAASEALALQEFEDLQGVEVVSTEDVLGLPCKGFHARRKKVFHRIHPAVKRIWRKIWKGAKRRLHKRLRRHYHSTLQNLEVDASSGVRHPQLETDSVHFMQEGIRHKEL